MSGTRHDRQFWERASREVERGAAIDDVAERLGVRPRTLMWWRWKLRRQARVGKRRKRRELARQADFVPIVVTHPPAVGGIVELDTGRERVRFEVGADVQYVAALVGALRTSC